MTTGDQGRTPPDTENYLDLSGVEDDQSGPEFDVVLRGYDRRQVDDHVAGLRRMNAQLRAQLAVLQRRQRSGAASSQGRPPVQWGSGAETDEGAVEVIPEARPPSEVAGVGESDEGGDVYGAFNDRLRGILQAAEQEAQLVRNRAAESLLAEHAESRAALADLRAQRDAVFDDLVRLRGWLDELVTTAGRPSGPPPRQLGQPGQHGQWPAGPRGPAPGPAGFRPQPHAQPQPQPRPRPRPGPPAVAARGADDDTRETLVEGEPEVVDGESDVVSEVDADTAESRAVSTDRSAAERSAG